MLKFISLLGTNRYIPCNYYLDDTKVQDCCYIQEAIIKISAQKGMTLDNIIIFTTQEAYVSNWVANKYSAQRSGLGKTLKNMFPPSSDRVKNIFIPSGNSERELWTLFDKLLNEMEEDDEIILDITHSFRFLPMLTFIVLNYARVVRHCKIRGIYYGAFETLGGSKEVEAMHLWNRNAPIFDLTPFVDLFDWTMGIDRYLSTGDSSIVSMLTEREIKKLNEQISRKIPKNKLAVERKTLFEDPNALKKLSDAMIKFSGVVSTCRGQDITNTALKLKNAINNVLDSTAQEYIKPLSPIMDMLKERFDRFSDDEYVNVIETTRWCLDNKMYQQGLTILEEGLISYACDMYGIAKIDKDNRNLISTYMKVVNNGSINTDCVTVGTSTITTKKFFTLLLNIGDLRNDINHAAWRNEYVKYNKFGSKLKDFLDRAEAIICPKISGKRMFLIFSHQLTTLQKQQAKEKFGVSEFIYLSDDLLSKWSNIPPTLEQIDEYLTDILKWINMNAYPGDYVLVQGDYGATMFVVNYCIMHNLKPVYATTQRIVKEEKAGEKVITSRKFEHIIFREYQKCKSQMLK